MAKIGQKWQFSIPKSQLISNPGIGIWNESRDPGIGFRDCKPYFSFKTCLAIYFTKEKVQSLAICDIWKIFYKDLFAHSYKNTTTNKGFQGLSFYLYQLHLYLAFCKSTLYTDFTKYFSDERKIPNLHTKVQIHSAFFK